MLPVKGFYTRQSIRQSIVVGKNWPEVWDERYLSTLDRKVQSFILDHASIASSMTGGLIGPLGCGLGRGKKAMLCGTEKDNVSCLQVRWRGQGSSRMLVMEGRRFN